MKITRNVIFICFILMLLINMPFKVKAGGLSTQLGEVVIENLQIGQTYNLKKLINLQLIVTNASDYAVELKMEVLSPDKSELRQGAEPIPDTAWVKLSQNFFKLSPKGKAISDIILSIPDNNRYLGKKYQVTIWSHTLPGGGGGMFVACGLKSRIILTLDKVRRAKSEAITSSDARVDFKLKPEEIFLEKVELGRVYDVEKNTGIVLKVTNPSEREQVFKLQSLKVRNSMATLVEEYQDAPYTSYLKFSESRFVLAPKGTKTIKIYLDFPRKKEYGGKKYMFVIHALAEGEKVTTGVYSRLYASIK
jgi:hypothetical protein